MVDDSQRNSGADQYERDCIAYLRKSVGVEGTTKQLREIEQKAAAIRWRIVKVLTDTDSTAYSRPGTARARRDNYDVLLGMLLADKRATPLGVMAWHADRLHRNNLEVEKFIEVCAEGRHPVETSRSGSYELWTPTGRRRIRDDTTAAAYEVDQLIDRVELDKLDLARKGKWLGGPVPQGWKQVRLDPDGDEKTLVLFPPMADAIEWGSFAVLRGVSLAAIEREWNGRGLRRRDGKPWTKVDVRAVLLRARNAGLMLHQGKIITTDLPGGKAEWPPIVDEEIWRSVVAVLSEESRRTSPGTQPRWIGSGLYECGTPVDEKGTECRRTVHSSHYGTPVRPGYRCPVSKASFPHVTRNSTTLDAFVNATMKARLGRPDVRTWLAEQEPANVSELWARLKGEQAKLAEWEELAEDPDSSPTLVDRGAKATQRRIAEIRAEIDRSTMSPLLRELASAEDIGALWDSRADDLKWRRAILGRFVTVVILPVTKGRMKGWKSGTPYFDPSGVRFEWKPLGETNPPS